MTDKEIIIDSIDIRECKHFEALYESRPNGSGGITIENYCYLYEDNCEKYPQCLYRSNQLQQLETQLKRKKQSEAKLVKQLQTICDFINNRPETFKGVYGGVDKIITEYAERKEQECEKYKQTLAKIKELVYELTN